MSRSATCFVLPKYVLPHLCLVHITDYKVDQFRRRHPAYPMDCSCPLFLQSMCCFDYHCPTSVGEHIERDWTSKKNVTNFRALSLFIKLCHCGHVSRSECPLVWLWSSAPPIYALLSSGCEVAVVGSPVQACECRQLASQVVQLDATPAVHTSILKVRTTLTNSHRSQPFITDSLKWTRNMLATHANFVERIVPAGLFNNFLALQKSYLSCVFVCAVIVSLGQQVDCDCLHDNHKLIRSPSRSVKFAC